MNSCHCTVLSIQHKLNWVPQNLSARQSLHLRTPVSGNIPLGILTTHQFTLIVPSYKETRASGPDLPTWNSPLIFTQVFTLFRFYLQILVTTCRHCFLPHKFFKDFLSCLPAILSEPVCEPEIQLLYKRSAFAQGSSSPALLNYLTT